MYKKRIIFGLITFVVMMSITGCSISNSLQDTANNNKKPNFDIKTQEKINRDVEVDFQEDGLTLEDYRIDVDNHEYEKGAIPKGSELTLNTYGVSGYKEIDGLVYPYLEQKVIDSKGNVIYEESDLIPEDMEGIDAETASETYTYLDIDDNFKSGEKYQWTTTYSDRKSDTNMDVLVNFIVE